MTRYWYSFNFDNVVKQENMPAARGSVNVGDEVKINYINDEDSPVTIKGVITGFYTDGNAFAGRSGIILGGIRVAAYRINYIEKLEG